MKTNFLTLLFCAMSLALCAQSFEGTITYKLEAQNPNPKRIPEDVWNEGIKQQFGEKGYLLHEYYYKNNLYSSSIEANNEKGYQSYNPEDYLLYSWTEDGDTAITVDTRKSMDEFVKFISNKETDTIMGIPCNSIILKSKMSTMTLWFNADHFKMDPTLFEGHLYGQWQYILEKLECLPLKIHTEGFMVNMTQTAIAFEEKTIDEAVFRIPEFEEVIANPMN